MAEKKEYVKLHNKGKREFLLTGGIKSMPGRAIDVEKSVADKFIKNYPRDFVLYEDLVAPSSTKAELKEASQKAKELEAANGKLAAELDELKASSTESAEALKKSAAELDELKKKSADKDKEITRLQGELKKAAAAKGGA